MYRLLAALRSRSAVPAMRSRRAWTYCPKSANSRHRCPFALRRPPQPDCAQPAWRGALLSGRGNSLRRLDVATLCRKWVCVLRTRASAEREDSLSEVKFHENYGTPINNVSFPGSNGSLKKKKKTLEKNTLNFKTTTLKKPVKMLVLRDSSLVFFFKVNFTSGEIQVGRCV